MDNTLGDFLSDEPLPETEAAVEQPEAVAEAEPVAAERPRDEHGRFKAKEETGVENTVEETTEPVPPTEPTDRLPQAQYAALKDERQKRQQLEAQLQEYQNYFAQLQAPQQQPQAIPDMFEDPEGFKEHLRNQILQELQPTLAQSNTLTRAEVSEMLARQKHEDYDATVEVFKEELAVNPHLLTQLQRAPDPAMYAYNVGKKVQQARAYGSEAPPTEAEIEARLREKIIGELGLNRPTAPSTFAGDRSVGSRSGPAWAGPTSMGDLLKP